MANPETSREANLSSGQQPVTPRWLWQGRIAPAFWMISSLVSMTVNVILIVALLLVGKQLFTLKKAIVPLVDGLDQNFELMDNAVIDTHVEVHDHIPVVFDLPLDTDTNVVLAEDTFIANATVNLSTGGLVIQRAPANIVLPKGTVLPVHLSLVVPVNTQVPVDLDVPVRIPLKDTELHRPFVGLREVLAPYKALLDGLPDSWEDLCGPEPAWWCDLTWGVMDAIP